MTTQNDGPLTPQMSVQAEGAAQVNAVGRISHVKHLHVGNRYQNQCQLLPPVVEHINAIPDNRDLTAWTDRARAQAELLRRIEDAQTLLIELVAAGGFGKSSIAVWLCEQVESEARQVIWVELAAASTFSAFARWVLYELCVPTDDTMPEAFLTQQLVRCLRKADCLLVIDQLEFIAQTQQRPFFDDFLTEWQLKQRNSTVLVTTRQRFLPQADLCLQLPGFTPDEGATFLQKKAVITALSDGLKALSTICNGHPLLLNLSAAWLKKTKENTLDEDGLDFFSKLFQNDLDDPETQVEEVFERLLDELSETLRLVLLEASVYQEQISLEMAQAMQPEVTAAELDSLELQGFLLGQDSQWRLHPLVGELVRDRRTDELEAEAHRKAIEYFQRQLQQEASSIQDYLDCFHHYYERQDYEAAYDVVDRCYSWLELNGNYRILVTRYEQLVTAWKAVPAINQSSQEKHGEALNRLGLAYSSQGDYTKAIDFQQQSLVIKQEIGDRNGIANSLGNLGLAYYSQGDYDKAIDFQQQSLVIKQEIGDRNGIAASLIGLANAYFSQGDYTKAIDFYQQSLEIKQEIGDRNGIANSLIGLGNAYFSQGDYDKAIDFHQQSLEITHQIGDRNNIAASLIGLGNTYASQGDYDKAIDFHQLSLEIKREIGDRNGIANSLCNLGLAYSAQGDYDKAIDFQQQALEIKREIGDRNGIATSLGNLGSAYKSQGDYDKAIDFQQQALEIKREIGDRKGIAINLFNLGIAYAKIDEHWKARDSYEQAKSVFTEIKLAHMVEKCDKAIQERSQIISPTPKKAPSLPTKSTEPDWLAKSMPATPDRSTARSQSSKRLFPKWLPYLALATAILLLVLLLQ